MEDMSEVFKDKSVIDSIPVNITVEVGSASIPLRQLKQFNQGSVIELDRLANENLHIKANGTLIGKGELVVVNERYGIRFVDSLTDEERYEDLKPEEEDE